MPFASSNAPVLGANGKVSNLVQMLTHARHPYIVINDSDIVISPRYLANVMSGFALTPEHKHPVGMVTAPYRGRAHGKPRREPTLGSRMEALGISTDFFPGEVVVERRARYLRFANDVIDHGPRSTTSHINPHCGIQ